MKLGLGTVQFGMDYGISNPAGQVSDGEVTNILSVAHLNDIRLIDTAALYGESEAMLGKTLPSGHQFKLVTKTVQFNSDRITVEDVSLLEQSFSSSLQKLRCSSVYGLLIHNVPDILAIDGCRLFECLTMLKQRGTVEKIGVSVYTAQQIEMVLERYDIDLIQLPVNILDQRLLQGGQLTQLKKAGVEIHARSPFLQGLLLMDPSSLPSRFDSVKTHLMRYHECISRWGLTPVQAALGFVSRLGEIDAVICGVTTHQQLEELCIASNPLRTADFAEFAINNDLILNPSKWQSIL